LDIPSEEGRSQPPKLGVKLKKIGGLKLKKIIKFGPKYFFFFFFYLGRTLRLGGAWLGGSGPPKLQGGSAPAFKLMNAVRTDKSL
jgi:hypothetical protein